MSLFIVVGICIEEQQLYINGNKLRGELRFSRKLYEKKILKGLELCQPFEIVMPESLEASTSLLE